jgi:hypothetical protein
VTLYVDGNPAWLSWCKPGGATKEHYMHLPLGPHTVEVQMAGTLGGCNTGAMSGWSGTLALNTDQPSTTTPVKAPPLPPVPPGDRKGRSPEAVLCLPTKSKRAADDDHSQATVDLDGISNKINDLGANAKETIGNVAMTRTPRTQAI